MEALKAGWLLPCLRSSGCQVQRRSVSLKSISLDGNTVELITTFVIGKRWGIGDRGLSVARHLCTECVCVCTHKSDSNRGLLICKAAALNASYVTAFGILPGVCTFVCCEGEETAPSTLPGSRDTAAMQLHATIRDAATCLWQESGKINIMHMHTYIFKYEWFISATNWVVSADVYWCKQNLSSA